MNGPIHPTRKPALLTEHGLMQPSAANSFWKLYPLVQDFLSRECQDQSKAEPSLNCDATTARINCSVLP